jgi:hypothetical protein
MQEDLNVVLGNATTSFHFAAQPEASLSIERSKCAFEIKTRGSISPVK